MIPWLESLSKDTRTCFSIFGLRKEDNCCSKSRFLQLMQINHNMIAVTKFLQSVSKRLRPALTECSASMNGIGPTFSQRVDTDRPVVLVNDDT